MATQSEIKNFLEKIKSPVQEDMRKTKILASLSAAQAILESGWGLSGLTKKSNNLFGIKGSYNGAYVTCRTKEWINGEYVNVNANFKKYPSWAESISDHSALFLRLPRYSNLIGEKDYKTACKNVAADGYATSPTYAQSLINLIEQYKLYEWDSVTDVDFYKVDIQNVTKGDMETLTRICEELKLSHKIEKRSGLND